MLNPQHNEGKGLGTMDYAFRGDRFESDDLALPRPFTLEEIKIGEIYETTFSESTVLFSGNVSYQLVEDGLDIAIINKNLDSGESQTLYIDDITFNDRLTIINSRKATYYLEDAIFDYIIDHRFNYAIAMFQEAGLLTFDMEDDKIVKPAKGRRFMGQYAVDTNNRRVFNYIQDQIIYSGYAPSESTNVWHFCFNLGRSPHRTITWDDTDGILEFIRLAKEDIEVSQVEFALTHPNIAAHRIEEIDRYEALKDDLLGKDEASDIYMAVSRSLQQYIPDDFPQWKITINYLNPRFSSMKDTVGDETTYCAGILLRATLADRRARPPLGDAKLLEREVRASLDRCLVPLGFKAWIFAKLPTRDDGFVLFITKDSPNFREELYYQVDLRSFGIMGTDWLK